MKKTTFSKRKKIKLFFLYVCILCAIFIILMQIDTNRLMKQVRAALLSTDYYVNEERYNDSNFHQYYTNPNINYIVYNSDDDRYDINHWFNISGYVPNDEMEKVAQIDLKLNRIFTIHNFCDGYIWFSYSIRYKDEHGNDISGTATSPYDPVKMKIHKENGEWNVVQIWERP